MESITLHDIKAEQIKLAKMIATFEAQARESIHFPEQMIELNHGEQWAGIIIGKDGEPNHHLILLPGEADSIDWPDANEWAAEQGGELPSRREQALLYANLKEQFKPEWYWSGEQHENKSYAWYLNFSYGDQDTSYTDDRLRARCVRRLVIE